mmetsp:Transcript_13439/g.57305  ORF Transcript_13439/g.57305 Transcript_13439/m.57305 type:complete len:231 (-) Transcript_13439:2627-3319(-)
MGGKDKNASSSRCAVFGECAFVATLEKDAALCERWNAETPDRLSRAASRIGRDGRRPPRLSSNAPVSPDAALRSVPALWNVSASTSSLCERRWWNGTGGLPPSGAVGDGTVAGTVVECLSVAPRPAPFPVERDRDRDPDPFPIELSAPELPASPPSASSALLAFSPAASASAARSADEDVAECSRDEALGAFRARAGDAGPTRSTRPESSVLSESEDSPPPIRGETPERP